MFHLFHGRCSERSGETRKIAYKGIKANNFVQLLSDVAMERKLLTLYVTLYHLKHHGVHTMIQARTTLPLLAALTSFATGCAVGGGTDDARRSRAKEEPVQVEPSSKASVVDPVSSPSRSIRQVSLFDITAALRDALGAHRDGTFLDTAVWARDNDARNAMQQQHWALAHVANDGRALVRVQEDSLARRANQRVVLGADTETTIAVIAALSDPRERTSLQYFLSADHSADHKIAAMRGYMNAVEQAQIETRLEALHSLLTDQDHLRTFALGAAQAYPMRAGETALALLELRFASLVATELRGARALATAYAFDTVMRPAQASEGTEAIAKLEASLKVRLKQQSAAYLEAAALLEIQLGHDVRMAESDGSGSFNTPQWLSGWLGRASLVGHIARDAAAPMREQQSVLHVAFLARGMDEDIVTLRGELTHREGDRVCVSQLPGECSEWRWNGETLTVPFEAKVKARRINMPELTGQYGYISRQADGAHLVRSSAWSLIEGTVAIPRSAHGDPNNESAWVQWSTDSFSAARIEVRPEAPGMFMAGQDLRYHGRSMNLNQLPWQLQNRGEGQFLDKASVLAAGVQTRVEGADGSEAEQSMSLPLQIDGGMDSVQVFGNWNLNRKLVGGTKTESGVSIDCAASSAAIANKQSRNGLFLNHTRLAGRPSFGAPELCRSADTLLVNSMSDAAVQNFEGVQAAYNETFYRDGSFDRGNAITLTLTSGVSSSDASPYYASDAASLTSFIVLVK
jgi:hypothetical protein